MSEAEKLLGTIVALADGAALWHMPTRDVLRRLQIDNDDLSSHHLFFGRPHIVVLSYVQTPELDPRPDALVFAERARIPHPHISDNRLHNVRDITPPLLPNHMWIDIGVDSGQRISGVDLHSRDETLFHPSEAATTLLVNLVADVVEEHRVDINCIATSDFAAWSDLESSVAVSLTRAFVLAEVFIERVGGRRLVRRRHPGHFEGRTESIDLGAWQVIVQTIPFYTPTDTRAEHIVERVVMLPTDPDADIAKLVSFPE